MHRSHDRKGSFVDSTTDMAGIRIYAKTKDGQRPIEALYNIVRLLPKEWKLVDYTNHLIFNYTRRYPVPNISVKFVIEGHKARLPFEVQIGPEESDYTLEGTFYFKKS